MSDKADPRAVLAAAQAQLAGALAGGDVPDGFDASRVALAARMLIDKRRRAVAHLLPMVAQSLGNEFTPTFDAYARRAPHPPDGQGVCDAADFLQTIPTSMLNDAARAEAMVFCLRHKRRWAATWLAGRGGLLVGIRLPLVGSRVMRLPLLRTGLRRAKRT